MINKSVESLNPCKSVIHTSYDIVKAHGGEIKIVTENNVGTTFTINLPTNS